jgi:hypothetical protein
LVSPDVCRVRRDRKDRPARAGHKDCRGRQAPKAIGATKG